MLHSCELAHALGWDLAHQDECGQSGTAPADSCDHCGLCKTLDSGGISFSPAKVSVPDCVAVILLWQPLLTSLVVAPPASITAVPRGDQTYPPPRWQFAERTALPPRAPSLLA